MSHLTSSAPAENDLCLCSMRVGGELFAIATADVREVLGEADILRVPLAPHFVRGITPYRGDVLLTLSLRSILGLPAAARRESVVVLQNDASSECFAVAVDSVDEVIHVAGDACIANLCTLDPRRRAILHGVYERAGTLVSRLNPQHLTPARLLEQFPCTGKESPCAH